jgi:hypothetical protein
MIARGGGARDAWAASRRFGDSTLVVPSFGSAIRATHGCDTELPIALARTYLIGHYALPEGGQAHTGNSVNGLPVHRLPSGHYARSERSSSDGQQVVVGENARTHFTARLSGDCLAVAFPECDG